MYPNSLPYVLALVATAVLTAGLALRAFSHRHEDAGVRTLGLLLMAVTFYAAAAGLELMAPTLDGKILAAQLKLASFGAVGPLWLALALRYSRRVHWLSLTNRVLIAMPGLLSFLAAIGNARLHLMWTGFALDPASPALQVTGFGVMFWVFLAAQYVFMLAAAAVYFQLITQAARIYRQQIWLMMAGALVPLAGNLITLAGIYPVRGLDLTPFSFALSAVFLATGLFSLRLLDVQPVAARVVFNHLSEAVLVLDGHDRVIDLNPAARKLFGISEAIIGRLPPGGVLDALSTPATVEAPQPELELLDGDAPGWYRLEISPLRDAYGRFAGRVVLLRDMTSERQLQQLRSDLTHMLIHDLTNPLSAMQMALELVQLEQAGPGEPIFAGPDALDAVEIIRRSNLRAQRLVAGLLDVSRLESGNMPLELEAVDAAGVVDSVLQELGPWAGERQLNLETSFAPDVPEVQADADMLDRVIRNLVGNAIKFTPPGGRITLAVVSDATYVRFSIQDTGPGLPAAVQARLFQKFVRGTGPQRGHGLGLAFCKLAVEAMGGHIWAESAAGRGTSFHFTLQPAGPEPGPRADAQAERPVMPMSQPATSDQATPAD